MEGEDSHFILSNSDKSIFAPSADNVQKGFRRAELLPVSVSGTDPSTTGHKTMHFSVMKDDSRPLNSSHEYQIFFLESNDYSTNQITLKYGTILDGPKPADADTLTVTGNVNSNPVQNIYSTKFTPGVWHNFGLVLNFNSGYVFYHFIHATLSARENSRMALNDCFAHTKIGQHKSTIPQTATPSLQSARRCRTISADKDSTISVS